MSFADLFRVKKIKAENEQLKAKMSALEKNLSDLGFTEYEQTKAAIDRLNTDISSSTTILERLREQIDLSRQEAENNEKRSATAVRKLSKSKEIYKSVEYAIDNFLNYAPPAGTCKISPADSNELEELLPSVILKLHCMDMRDLRKAYNENNNRINELQKKYEARYTTNANLIKFAKTVFFPSREKGSFFLAVSCQGIPATPSWAVARLQIFLKTIFCCQDASAKGHPCALRFSQDSAHRLRTDFVNPRPQPLSIFLDRVAICLIECGSQQHTFRRGRRPLRPSVETGKRQLWPRRSAATTNLLCPPFHFFRIAAQHVWKTQSAEIHAHEKESGQTDCSLGGSIYLPDS